MGKLRLPAKSSRSPAFSNDEFRNDKRGIMNRTMRIIALAVLSFLVACSEKERSTMDSEKPSNVIALAASSVTTASSEVSAASGVATSDTLAPAASQPSAASSVSSTTESQLPPNESEQIRKYEAAKLVYQAKIDAALIKYRAIPKTSDVRPLIELDKELIAISKTDPGETRDLFKKEYEEIGFDIVGSYGLGYTGGMLFEAHKRNPNSPYREDTLFAKLKTEFDNDTGVRLEPIYEYLKEYPHGSHATDAYMFIGDAYRDIYRVLWEFETDAPSKGRLGYKCYEHFVTKEPYSDQMKKAKAAAIENYQMAQKYISEYVEFYNKQIAAKIKSLDPKGKPHYVMGCGLAGD